jgi:hypothetical protein
MNDDLRAIIQGIDSFGFDGNSFGLAEGAPRLGAAGSLAQRLSAPNQTNMTPPSIATNYTVNSAIQQLTAGCSTSQLTITVTKTGAGSGNTYNPVFLFGSDAFSNTSKGYTAVTVNSPVQATSLAFTNNKNVVVFTYAADPGVAQSVYKVSQTTDGEYPFWLNSLTGDKSNIVNAMQLTLGDAADEAQLQNTIQTFELNQFGKSISNDLTQPKDLYQQQTNGLWITNPFEISGRKGIKINVNETNNMVLNLFMYVKPGKGCGC